MAGLCVAGVIEVGIGCGFGGAVIQANSDSGLGRCSVSATANASAYDDGRAGASGGSLNVDDYSASDCAGLSQTFAIYQAGLACVSADIPSGVVSGIGFAVVTWTTAWTTDVGDSLTVGPIQQQYDCVDTFT